MTRLLDRIRHNHALYRQFKTRFDDVADIVSAILITLGFVALAIGAGVLGGSHG